MQNHPGMYHAFGRQKQKNRAIFSFVEFASRFFPAEQYGQYAELCKSRNIDTQINPKAANSISKRGDIYMNSSITIPNVEGGANASIANQNLPKGMPDIPVDQVRRTFFRRAIGDLANLLKNDDVLEFVTNEAVNQARSLTEAGKEVTFESIFSHAVCAPISFPMRAKYLIADLLDFSNSTARKLAKKPGADSVEEIFISETNKIAECLRDFDICHQVISCINKASTIMQESKHRNHLLDNKEFENEMSSSLPELSENAMHTVICFLFIAQSRADRAFGGA